MSAVVSSSIDWGDRGERCVRYSLGCRERRLLLMGRGGHVAASESSVDDGGTIAGGLSWCRFQLTLLAKPRQTMPRASFPSLVKFTTMQQGACFKLVTPTRTDLPRTAAMSGRAESCPHPPGSRGSRCPFVFSRFHRLLTAGTVVLVNGPGYLPGRSSVRHTEHLGKRMGPCFFPVDFVGGAVCRSF